MRSRAKAPAAPGSVFDNFLLLYVHMLIVALAYMLARTDASKSHHIGYTSSALHFPVYSSA